MFLKHITSFLKYQLRDNLYSQIYKPALSTETMNPLTCLTLGHNRISTITNKVNITEKFQQESANFWNIVKM